MPGSAAQTQSPKVGCRREITSSPCSAIAWRGDILIRLKKRRRNGVTEWTYSPHAFIARLLALVPPTGCHTIRYFGVFSSGSPFRPYVVPAPPQSSPTRPVAPARPSRMRWADLHMRVWQRDILACPCGGRLLEGACCYRLWSDSGVCGPDNCGGSYGTCAQDQYCSPGLGGFCHPLDAHLKMHCPSQTGVKVSATYVNEVNPFFNGQCDYGNDKVPVDDRDSDIAIEFGATYPDGQGAEINLTLSCGGKTTPIIQWSGFLNPSKEVVVSHKEWDICPPPN